MKKSLVVLLGILIYGLALPTLTSAQSGSKDFPNTEGAPCAGPARNIPSPGGGTMHFKVKLEGVSQKLDSGAVPGAACDEGRTAAVNGANALCSAALAGSDWTPSAVLGCAMPACCASAVGTTSIIKFTSTAVPSEAFLITRFANDKMFTVGAEDTELILSVLSSTNAGNPIGTDPLPNWIFQAAPGVNGILTFRVDHTCGGPDPRTFTVDTTGKTTLQTAEAVRDGFNGLGLSPGCSVVPVASVPPAGTIGNYTALPEEFSSEGWGFFVRVEHADSVQSIDVKGPPGMLIVSEGNTTPAGAIPTLSEWGVIGLILLMAASALWMLRRRSTAPRTI